MNPYCLNRPVSTASRLFSVYPPNFQVRATPIFRYSYPLGILKQHTANYHYNLSLTSVFLACLKLIEVLPKRQVRPRRNWRGLYQPSLC